ncbi:MAG: thymidylate synthase (FAD) [Clostridiales bacterium]|nr:thymidylate synthase (FAD) [Clostridiales bacterium]
MPECNLHVIMLAHTPDPETTCALAARTCYSALDAEGLHEKVSTTDQSKFLKGIVASGHLSVLEHASFTFFAEGVSRALLAQISRHRIASFSVQSQRYVSLEKGFDYIIPPRIKALGEDAVEEYSNEMEQMHRWYTAWQEKLGENANEDARFVLPNACETHITFTMNARELLHFFSLRCCNRAQWEIRELATEMLRLCKQVAPVIFENAGPGCISGACPEGSRSCGEAKAMREKFAAL